LLFASYTQAQVGGNATYTFLKLTNSARVAALGGENISINDKDLNFVYHNPALLDSGMNNNLVLNYVNYFAGINYGYAAYAKKIKKAGIFAAGIHYINYGKFVQADPTGKITGTFKASEMALNIFWAKPLIDSVLKLGLNLKPIYSHLDTYNSFGLALDAGLLYTARSKLFSASFAIKNFGSQLKPYVQGNYEPLPFDLLLGFTQKLEHAPFRFSVTLHHLYKWDMTYDPNSNQAYTYVDNNQLQTEEYQFNILDNIMRHSIFSMEFIPSKNFIVMAAYNHQRRMEMMVETKPFLIGFSWGFYIHVYKLSIGFGQSIYHLAGASNHFSINFNLSDFYTMQK
jgi:hypothetical protein